MYLPINRESARPHQFKYTRPNIRIPFPHMRLLAYLFALAYVGMPFQAE